MASNVISILIAARDEASRTFEGVGSSARAMATKVADAGLSAAKYGGTALAGAITLAAKASWDQVDAVQQATVGLQAYERDGSKVSNVLKSLVSYARSDMGVLFNRKDLFDSAQSLKIMGDDTADLSDHVKILSRSVGLGLSNWSELNQIVGRVGSTGRLTGDDFDNLTKAGYRLDPSLRNTNVSFSTLFKALDKGIPVDAMAGQADTIHGIGIRLQTAFRSIGNEILGVDADTNKFVEGGLGSRLVGAMQSSIGLLKNVGSFIGPAISEFLKAGDRLGASLVEGYEARIAQFTDISGLLLDKLKDGDYEGAGRQVATGLVHGLQALVDRARDIYNSVAQAVGKVDWVGLGITFGSKVVPGLVLGLAAGLLNIDLGALAGGIKDHLFEVVMGVLSIAFAPARIVGKLGEILSKIPMAGKLLEWAVVSLNEFGQSILGKVGELLGIFGNAFVENLGLQAPRVVPAIRGFLQAIPDAIANFAVMVNNKAGDMMFGLGNTIAELGPRQVVSALQSVRSAIGGAFSSAGSWLWDAGTKIISGLIEGIKSVLGTVGGPLASMVKSALHAIHIPGFESGGFTGPGPSNEVAGVVHRGEYVIPKQDVDQRTGKPKAGAGGVVVNVTNHNYSDTDHEANARELGWRIAQYA